MTAFTKSTPGAPEGGFYSEGDTVTDSASVVWTCVVGGFAKSPSAFGYGRAAQFVAQPPTQVNAYKVGTAGTNVTAVEQGSGGGVHKTILTVASVAQNVVNGTEYQSSLVYTFPEGRILLLGAFSTIAQTTTSAILTTLNSGTGALGLGSAAASNVSLTGTMVDMGPSTAFTSSATINVAGTAVTSVLAASAQFDGHTTPTPVYLNTAYATTTDVDADATQTLSGTITLVWVWIGDY